MSHNCATFRKRCANFSGKCARLFAPELHCKFKVKECSDRKFYTIENLAPPPQLYWADKVKFFKGFCQSLKICNSLPPVVKLSLFLLRFNKYYFFVRFLMDFLKNT